MSRSSVGPLYNEVDQFAQKVHVRRGLQLASDILERPPRAGGVSLGDANGILDRAMAGDKLPKKRDIVDRLRFTHVMVDTGSGLREHPKSLGSLTVAGGSQRVDQYQRV